MFVSCAAALRFGVVTVCQNAQLAEPGRLARQNPSSGADGSVAIRDVSALSK